MWNHFTNDWRNPPIGENNPNRHPGPRTTNHAEGWHNRLNVDFGHPHPAVNKFLHWLQESHHANQVRIRQLQHGAPPRARDQVYVRIDRNISTAKVMFIQHRALLQGQDALIRESETYLRYIMYRLG